MISIAISDFDFSTDFASEDSTHSDNMERRRKETLDWEPWFEFLDDGKHTVKCVFCGSCMIYKKERAFNHYGYNAKGSKGICTKAPPLVKRLFANCGYIIPKRLTAAELWGASSAPAAIARTPGSSQSTQNNGLEDNNRVFSLGSQGPEESLEEPSRGASCTLRSRSSRQQELNEAYHLLKRKELDGKWSSFFYEANVAFNIVRHPAFVEAVRATARAGFHYEPPSYNAIRTSLLETKKKAVEADVQKQTQYSIHTYGASLCTDGWDNIGRRPLMNIMVCCPAGDVFLGSIDTTGNKKTKTYIAGELKTYIEKVGPKLVTQVCTDNASNMLGAMDDVVRSYPWIYKQGCAAHALDLLLEDWAKIPTFKDLITKAKRVCLFIRNHHTTMALFREYSKDKMLLVPAETRFACNFLMICRMLEVREALRNVVVHEQFMEYVGTLFNRQNGRRIHALAGAVRTTVLNNDFWHRCQNYTHMVDDVLKALRLFDGRQPAMAQAWLTMNNLKKHIFKLRNPPFSLPSRIATRIETTFTKRWEMMITDLHYAGALLNPYLRNVRELEDNHEAKRALNRVFRKLGPALGLRWNDLHAEMEEFNERTGPYSPEETPDIREANLLPHQWWHRVGGASLPKLAQRVLSLACSASSCERNWSMYSFVHNKSRNRLGVKKAEELVYIYSNSKLLRAREGADAARWYVDNLHANDVMSEESDPDRSDGSTSDDSGYDNDGGDGGRREEGEWSDREETHDPATARSRDEDHLWSDREDDVEEEPLEARFEGDVRSDMDHRGDQVPHDRTNMAVFDWEEFDEENRTENVRVYSPVTGNDYDDRRYESSEHYDDVRDDDDDDDNDENNNNIGVNIGGTDDDCSDGDDENNASSVPVEVGIEEVMSASPKVSETVGGNVQAWLGAPNQSNNITIPMLNPVDGYDDNTTTVLGIEENRGSTVPIVPEEVVNSGGGSPNTFIGNGNCSITSLTPSLGARLVSVRNAGIGPAMRPPMPKRMRNISPSNDTQLLHTSEPLSLSQQGPSSAVRSHAMPSTMLHGGQPSNNEVEKRGSKRPNSGILPFLDTHILEDNLSTPIEVIRRGPQVGSDADDPNAKRRKRFVKTKIGRRYTIELRNENSEVEGLVRTAYGNEDGILGDGDDEKGEDTDGGSDNSGDERVEAPEDPDVRVRQVDVPHDTSGSRLRRSDRLRKDTDDVSSDENIV